MKTFNDLPVHSYALPSLPVTDKRFVWKNAAATDVRETWKRFGWKPVKHSRKQGIA
jgi:hypothetical protein